MQGIGITEKKNTFTIEYDNTQLTFSGNFDSGNLNWVGLNEQTHEIQLHFGKDRDVKPSAKCWFHFSISGNYTFQPVKLHLLKTNSLNMVSKIYDLYRPVVRVEGGEWARHTSPVEFEISAENDVSFHMELQLYGSRTFYIANCYPWSLTDNEKYFKELEKSLSIRKDIYFNRETLIMSVENHPIHLVALSSGEVASNPPEDYLEHLFPKRQTETHYKMIKKPLIMITSRVHPGEVGSSHSLNGMIEYLTSRNPDARKMMEQFYFLIIPILNPDGVFNGNNRMDALGQNLNRFYLFPELEKQPTCYAVKELLEKVRHQVFAFFDLHGHANKKSCFLFGNSINNQRLQVESVLFAKHLSTICDYVEFKSCNFSKKQMSSKDKNEDFSKEGCARVVVHKWTNSPYVYTLETGLYKNVLVDDKGIERYGQEFYGPRIYAEVGAKMLISLYAILKKDKKIEEMRKQVTEHVIKLEKMNAKKQVKKKGTKKNIGSSEEDKKVKNEAKSDKVIKVEDEKQNEKRTEKIKGLEEVLQKNKNYLLSLDEDDDS